MSKWIEFEHCPPKEGKKTSLWIVKNKESCTTIGLVKWYSAWRTYAFFPANDTIFEDDCLYDIAQFIKDKMTERIANKINGI